MKLRILNYRVTARHDLIVGLDSIRQAISIMPIIRTLTFSADRPRSAT